jgi:hypothetical protein
MLVVGTLGGELQMPLKPSFFYAFMFLYSFMVSLTTALVMKAAYRRVVVLLLNNQLEN